MPPPGAGLKTVIDTVPAVAVSEGPIVALSCVAETKVVVRLLPPHFTTDAETKPVPLTVSVKPGAMPGDWAVGTSG